MPTRRARSPGVTAMLALALAAAAPARGAEADEPLRIELAPGEVLPICRTGTILCPAKDAICDDLSVATAVSTAEGLALKGLKPGTTLCSAASASGSGVRRVYRIVVREKT
jgi:hypothetical protein